MGCNVPCPMTIGLLKEAIADMPDDLDILCDIKCNNISLTMGLMDLEVMEYDSDPHVLLYMNIYNSELIKEE